MQEGPPEWREPRERRELPEPPEPQARLALPERLARLGPPGCKAECPVLPVRLEPLALPGLRV